MTSPMALAADLVAKLTSAGVRATVDARNAAPPCVLVEVDRVEPLTSCSGRAFVTLRAIAPGPGSADALAWLWGAAFTALASITGGPITRDTFSELPAITAEYVGTVDWNS